MHVRCHHHNGTGGFIWYLSSSLSLLVGFSSQDEALGDAQSTEQGIQCHANAIYLQTELMELKNNTI